MIQQIASSFLGTVLAVAVMTHTLEALDKYKAARKLKK